MAEVVADSILIYVILQALTTLKQKVRKYNKDFEAEIESFRENPVNSEEEREEEAGETTAHTEYTALSVEGRHWH